MSTGTGNLGLGTGSYAAVYPVVTKGTAEAENGNADINYYLAIDENGKIAADFEEAEAGTNATGLNHPIVGNTTVPLGEWHHIAATYDGSTWNLYLDGQSDGTLVVGEPANAANLAMVGVGRAFKTDGSAAGAFSGSIDEVRIWNVARAAGEIAASFDQEIDVATTGLVARWGMNEDSGAAVPDSIGTNDGLLVNGTRGPGFEPTVPPVQPAVSFDGSNDYVTFGPAPTLGLPAFTLEGWFRRDGAGDTVSTGTGGVVAVPLITKGRGEADGDNRDMNYFFGIHGTNGTLVADFEDMASGLNHPVRGIHLDRERPVVSRRRHVRRFHVESVSRW